MWSYSTPNQARMVRSEGVHPLYQVQVILGKVNVGVAPAKPRK